MMESGLAQGSKDSPHLSANEEVSKVYLGHGKTTQPTIEREEIPLPRGKVSTCQYVLLNPISHSYPL